MGRTQPPDSPSQGAVGKGEHWQLEEVRLADGRALRGLIEHEGPHSLQFVEIRQPPGKPMFGVVRRIARVQVRGIDRLEGPPRRQLIDRVERFRNRLRLEALQTEQVTLERDPQDGHSLWRYEDRNDEGHYFTLISDLDEATTRRVVVRLDQMFCAYRRLLPPHADAELRPGRPLEVRVFGTMEQYRGYLSQHGLPIEHPAFYSAPRNLIAAGSNLEALANELAKSRRQDEAVLRTYQQQMQQADRERRAWVARLRKAGLSDEQRALALKAIYQPHVKDLADVQRAIQVNERRNEALFDETASRTFRRLYHEAFHAYLENYVYPHRRYDVPRWLNEGLAQVFEQGYLEADTLRLDAPNAERLKPLQADLRRQPLSLADLLRADQDAFLVTHQKSPGGSTRHYLYSWGLAYYLTMERPLLTRQALDRYVSLEEAKRPALERFERLVDQPLDQFQKQWREAMLALVPISGK